MIENLINVRTPALDSNDSFMFDSVYQCLQLLQAFKLKNNFSKTLLGDTGLRTVPNTVYNFHVCLDNLLTVEVARSSQIVLPKPYMESLSELSVLCACWKAPSSCFPPHRTILACQRILHHHVPAPLSKKVLVKCREDVTIKLFMNRDFNPVNFCMLAMSWCTKCSTEHSRVSKGGWGKFFFSEEVNHLHATLL